MLKNKKNDNTKSNHKRAVDVQDSLALVALNNSTNEANSNWLTGNIVDWYGITL